MLLVLGGGGIISPSDSVNWNLTEILALTLIITDQYGDRLSFIACVVSNQVKCSSGKYSQLQKA
jgi:hypothetical protein